MHLLNIISYFFFRVIKILDLLASQSLFSLILSILLNFSTLCSLSSVLEICLIRLRSMWHKRGKHKRYGQRVASGKDVNFCESCWNTSLNTRSLYASKDYNNIQNSCFVVWFWMYSSSVWGVTDGMSSLKVAVLFFWENFIKIFSRTSTFEFFLK